MAGYGGSTHPALLAAIRRLNAPDDAKAVLLATTWAESGGRLDAVGDNGKSHGPYQEYDYGRGSGIPIAQRRDPVASTNRAWNEYQTYYNKGARGGELAYRAQRPANQSAYINKINSYLGEARKVLGQGGATSSTAPQIGNPASPATGVAQNESPQSNDQGLAASMGMAIAGRQKGQSLFDTVVAGFLGAPAMTQKAGVQANPQGNAARGQQSPGASGQDEPGVVGAARRYLGTPYSWGGGTPSGPSEGFAQGAGIVGFDCSSLVQMAWAKAGVSLPRTTYGQIKVGQAVATNNMASWKKGDLLFPSTGHVQMYIGNGQIIEAPRTGGVVQVKPARSSYIAVRRPG